MEGQQPSSIVSQVITGKQIKFQMLEYETKSAMLKELNQSSSTVDRETR